MKKRWTSGLLSLLLVLLLFSGCSALEALEQLKDRDGPESSDSSVSEPSSVSSSGGETSSTLEPAPSSGGEEISTPEPAPPSGSERPTFPEDEWEPEPEDAALEMLQEEISRNGGVVGVAFIGYMSNESSEMDLRAGIAQSEIGKRYPFLNYAMLLMSEGDEVYAVVPCCEQGSIRVYPSMMSEQGEYVDDKNTPLFEGLPGEPLLLQCNLSEHYSNVLITADDGFGAVDYRPGISMKDGRLAKEAGVYDFSIYEAALEEDTVQSAMDLLMQTEEIQMAMQQGMSPACSSPLAPARRTTLSGRAITPWTAICSMPLTTSMASGRRSGSGETKGEAAEQKPCSAGALWKTDGPIMFQYVDWRCCYERLLGTAETKGTQGRLVHHHPRTGGGYRSGCGWNHRDCDRPDCRRRL